MALNTAVLTNFLDKLKAGDAFGKWFSHTPSVSSAASVAAPGVGARLLLIGFVLMAAAALGMHMLKQRHDAAVLAQIAQVQSGVQRLAREMQQIALGLPQGVEQLQQSHARTDAAAQALAQARGLLAYGGTTQAALQHYVEQWRAMDRQLAGIDPGSLSAAAARVAPGLAKAGDRLVADGEALIDAVRSDTRASLWLGLAVIFIVLAGALMVVLSRRRMAEVQARFAHIEQTNLRNQEAVLRLLDEMGDLADGDLTVTAEVTESITGAIADSINYTIDSLRTLVAEINHATEQVTSASGEAQAITSRLQAAAQKQAQQIREAGMAVQQMAQSIQEVSANASRSAEVAQRSLQAATQGAVAVQNTIAGMNDIRTQIQETSKRIKRLGESSQEIGEIVELISDITEQTNILALNAAIQAASAGEAGRGFTVVAEEVQRLAERSSEATRQIGAIVKTIQQDTHDAVSAMERSTAGVVEGTRLSDTAGQALNEIGAVTSSLAQLIASISQASSAQTEMGQKVSLLMQEIQAITTQTTEGTQLTAGSIGQLAALAEELRASVSGFKLA